MKHEITIRLVKKQGFFNEKFYIDSKNGDQAAIAGEAFASSLFDNNKDIITYSIIGIHPVNEIENGIIKTEATPIKKKARIAQKKRAVKDISLPKKLSKKGTKHDE